MGMVLNQAQGSGMEAPQVRSVGGACVAHTALLDRWVGVVGVQAVVLVNLGDNAPPGAVAFEAGDHGLFFVCPCGCGAEDYLPFRGPDGRPRPSWLWDGNREAPTLSPSIRRTAGCRWHGFLRSGIWEAV
jgi:hypothetical protein